MTTPAAGWRAVAPVRWAVALALVASCLVAAPSPALASDLGAIEARLVTALNGVRAQSGLGSVGINDRARTVARDWSRRMAAEGVMTHNPDRADQLGSVAITSSENIGWRRGSSSLASLADAIHGAWLESAPHWAAMHDPRWTHVGIGLAVAEDGGLWATAIFLVAAEPAALAEGLAASQATWTGSSRPDAVAIARADVYADALAGGALLGTRGAMLFVDGPTATDPDPGLRSATAAEIARLLPDGGQVYLLGGANAVSPRIEQELRSAGHDVVRLAGEDRFGTAAAIAAEMVAREGRPEQVVIASGLAWPDAVAAGAWAATEGVPVLLTAPEGVPAATAQALDRMRGADRVVVGGTTAVSERVRRQLGARRVSGSTRDATAVAIAEELASRTVGRDGDRFLIAPGWGRDDAWGAALAWTPWAARHDATLLLAADHQLPGATIDHLARRGYTAERRATAVRRTPASPQILTELRDLLGG